MASGLSNEYLVSLASGETQGKVSMPAPNNAQNQLQSIEALLQRIEKANDPAMSAMAKDLVQRLMEFHGAGIERMLEIIHKDAAGQDNVIDALGQDPLVRSLLLLYGVHPDGLETRVQQALEKTRPYLKSHGGNVSLIGVDDAGTVTLRLEGSCHGCASSSATLKLAVEEAIYEAAPDITAITVEGEERSHSVAFVPLSALGGNGHESTSKLNEAAPSFSEVTRSAV
jgi:Fe-S cluster biogenesis protein NfuA